MSDFVVVTQHPKLLTYVDSLQKKNAEALSFYPRQVFERESSKGRIFLGLLNNEPCGYVYAGAIGQTVKCHQVCIQYDARRLLYGKQLVVILEDYALKGFASEIQLRCGHDLEANKFWESMGYQCIDIQNGGIRRLRKINIWSKQIRPLLFENEPLNPSIGKTDSSVWRKNKKTGLINQFVRGSKLQEYRRLIIDE